MYVSRLNIYLFNQGMHFMANAIDTIVPFIRFLPLNFERLPEILPPPTVSDFII